MSAPTTLMRVTGTTPRGARSLKLKILCRVAGNAKQAAELARNYWKSLGVTITQFKVQAYNEPQFVGIVWRIPREVDGSFTVFDLIDNNLVLSSNEEKEPIHP